MGTLGIGIQFSLLKSVFSGHLYYRNWMPIPRTPVYIFSILRHQVKIIHTPFLWRTHLLTQISFKTGVLVLPEAIKTEATQTKPKELLTKYDRYK